MKPIVTSRTAGLSAVIAAGISLAVATPARADDYTDLLDVLRAQGSISQQSYTALRNKHLGVPRAVPTRPGATRATAPGASTPAENPPSGLGTAAEAERPRQPIPGMPENMPAGSELVYALPYTPGKGITVHAGDVTVNISGFVNAFYAYSFADKKKNTGVGGGLADNSGFDSSSIRTGLLPAALIFKASTTQAGIDLATVFGIYPGINSANTNTPFNANSGGSPHALGTAGVDFRQAYVTAGTKSYGTFKFGRDIGIFGSDAILNDQTLIGVGATGGNANPANTSLGRIGIGYIYADFMAQISYASPIWAGLQATVGAFTPLDETNFSGLSGTASAHDTPMFQGKVTYDATFGPATVHAWTSGLVQPQQNLAGSGITTTGKSITASAFDVGAKVDLGLFGALGYYYRGTGVGTTALFFDGIDNAGHARDSEGYYVQGSVKPLPKLKLVASYGQSGLNQAPGENDPALVRINRAEIAGAYYSLTDWLTLVAEFSHTEARSHGTANSNANAVDAGGIVFF